MDEHKFWDDFRNGVSSVWIYTKEERDNFFHSAESQGIKIANWDLYSYNDVAFHCDIPGVIYQAHRGFYIETLGEFHAEYFVEWGSMWFESYNLTTEEFLKIIGLDGEQL